MPGTVSPGFYNISTSNKKVWDRNSASRTQSLWKRRMAVGEDKGPRQTVRADSAIFAQESGTGSYTYSAKFAPVTM